MPKFNLKSVYSADKPYTVIEQLDAFVDYIDNLEYTVLYRHEVLCSFAGNSHTIVFNSPRSEKYTNEELNEFIADFRKYYCVNNSDKGPVTIIYTYSKNYYFTRYDYVGSTIQNIRYNNLHVDFANPTSASETYVDLSTITSDTVTTL